MGGGDTPARLNTSGPDPNLTPRLRPLNQFNPVIVARP